MSFHNFALVTFKITGVYVLIKGLVILGLTIYSGSLLTKETPYSWAYILVTLFPFVLTMLIAFVLFRKTEWLAERLSVSMNHKVRDQVTDTELLRLMFVAVGIAILLEGLVRLITIPHLIQTTMQWTAPVTESQIKSLFDSIRLQTFGLLVKVLSGLYLIFWSGGLVKLWSRRSRKGGLIPE